MAAHGSSRVPLELVKRKGIYLSRDGALPAGSHSRLGIPDSRGSSYRQKQSPDPLFKRYSITSFPRLINVVFGVRRSCQVVLAFAEYTKASEDLVLAKEFFAESSGAGGDADMKEMARDEVRCIAPSSLSLACCFRCRRLLQAFFGFITVVFTDTSPSWNIFSPVFLPCRGHRAA